MSGGVALNCVANEILDEAGFKNIWIQPAAGDAGSSLGAALIYHYREKKEKRIINRFDSMQNAYLGPSFESQKISNFLLEKNIPFKKLNGSEIYEKTAVLLSQVT